MTVDKVKVAGPTTSAEGLEHLGLSSSGLGGQCPGVLAVAGKGEIEVIREGKERVGVEKRTGAGLARLKNP